MTDAEEKFSAVALLMGLWGVFVWKGLAPAPDYISAIKDLIAAVMGLHVIKNYGNTNGKN